MQFASTQRDIERAISGIGAASGATVDSINSVADATARTQRISTSSAREIATGYAGMGIKAPTIPGLTGITRDFAAQTGNSDLKAAAVELGKAFLDPVKGAETLNEKLGFLDGRTLGYIRTLSIATIGQERSVSFSTPCAALSTARPIASHGSPCSGSAWSRSTRTWRTQPAAPVTGPSLQEQLSSVNGRLQGLQSGGQAPASSGAAWRLSVGFCCRRRTALRASFESSPKLRSSRPPRQSAGPVARGGKLREGVRPVHRPSAAGSARARENPQAHCRRLKHREASKTSAWCSAILRRWSRHRRPA